MDEELSIILKELLAYFSDEWYRNWLYENREQYINAYRCFEIVTCLPIDLNEKLKYLRRIKPFLNDIFDDEFNATVKAYELGLELLYEEGSNILFQVTSRRRETIKGVEFYEDHTWPCHSYKQFVEYHESLFEDGENYKTIKYDDFWYVIERYRLVDNEYKYEADYVIKGNLNVISVYFPCFSDDNYCVLDKEIRRWYMDNMGHLYLPIFSSLLIMFMMMIMYLTCLII